MFQKLKDAKKNPVFMLKHIKDIRSPIVIAQQKLAARNTAKKSSLMTSSIPHPSKIAIAGVQPLNAASNGATRPILDIYDVSPSTEMNDTISSLHPEPTSSPAMQEDTDTSESLRTQAETQPSTKISYAVAIYPYMAEQDDEFEVAVGDMFIVLSRAKGWWVVQRDTTGDDDERKQGWAPAGCLLETNVPVAAAIETAKSFRVPAKFSPAPAAPILASNIVSTCFSGIALTDYRRKGDEEADLAKGDLVRVFKRYNHWSYVVKEDGDRGWVPSWFIGKDQNASGSELLSTTNITLDTDMSGSPMGSSAN